MNNYVQNADKNRDWTQLFSAIFISAVVLYFIFAPAINMLFYAGDDFRYALGGYNKACRLDDGFEFMLTLGRPVQAYMDCLSFKFAYTMERMRIIRIFAVIFMGCGMGLFARWLYQLKFNWGEAFAAAGAIFLLRSLFEDTIPTGALSLPFAILLAMFAYFILQYSYQKAHGRRYREHSSNCVMPAEAGIQNKPEKSLDVSVAWHDAVPQTLSRYMIYSALLVLGSMLTYPAMSFFFPVLILTKLLFSDLTGWNRTRREVVKEVFIFCIVAAVYFIWATYNMHYHPQAPVPDAYRVDHPNLNPSELLKRLVIIANVFSEHWVMFGFNGSHFAAWLTLFIVPIGVVCAILRFANSEFYAANRLKALHILSQNLLLAGIVFCLCSTFFLILPNLSLVELRILLGVLAARLVVFFWSVKQIAYWVDARPRILFFVTLFLYAAVEANIQTTVVSLAYGEYYQKIETALQNYLAKGVPLSRVHFIWSKQDGAYSGFFVTNAAMMRLLDNRQLAFKWCSLARGVPGEEKDNQRAMLACVKSLPKETVAVTYSYAGDPIAQSTEMLVINVPHAKTNYYTHFLKFYRTES